MRVLLAVDGSPCSEEAVRTVLDRFRPEDTQVKVLHAVEWMREMPLCIQYAHVSVAETVVRHAPCSVSIVRMPVAARQARAATIAASGIINVGTGERQGHRM